MNKTETKNIVNDLVDDIQKHVMYRYENGHFATHEYIYNPFQAVNELRGFTTRLTNRTKTKVEIGKSLIPADAAKKVIGKHIAIRATATLDTGIAVFWGVFDASAYLPQLKWDLDEHASTASDADLDKIFKSVAKAAHPDTLRAVFELVDYNMSASGARFRSRA